MISISAVIPAYNSARFLALAIESILQQTRPVDEIIVVDDGSTDETRKIAKSFGERITYIHQLNKGPSAARNRGIESAKGNWIAFLDADDQWTPDKIDKQLIALDKEPGLKLLAADMSEIDEAGNLLTKSMLAKHHFLERFQSLNGAPIPSALAELLKKNFIPTGTVLAEKSVLVDTGLFNSSIRFGEDLELWAKIACQHPITCLPEVMMLRRQHEKNATQSTAPMLEDLIAVMKSINAYSPEQLKKENINGSELVAEAYWQLGYWLFDHQNYNKARKNFLNSLKNSLNISALKYFVVCYLPRPLIRAIKKQISA